MSILFDCQRLSKTWASFPIFSDVTFSGFDGDRIGIIGPNGAGKSTLLKIIGGEVSADSGEITRRKGTSTSYVAQMPNFPPQLSIEELVQQSNPPTAHGEAAAAAKLQAQNMLMQAGFDNLAAAISSLSGGWQKRLAIVMGFAFEADLVLLDEPTNHLDLAGILWLEKILAKTRSSWLMVSHDRALLNATAKKIIEVNKTFPGNTLITDGNYLEHVSHRTQVLEGLQGLQESLQNKLRREKEWLSRGPKARGTKAKYRIDQAEVLKERVNELAHKASSKTIDFSFSEATTKSKILMKLENVCVDFADKKILTNLSFTVQNKQTIGILGNNGSGKSTLLNVMAGHIKAQSGTLTQLQNLRVVYFLQDRSSLNPELTLKQTLCPDSDSVNYQGQLLHFATWLRRFGFTQDHFHTKIGRLSGGEQARVLVALLMLEPADLLLLDEPTNDLDIQTLDALELSIREFAGATIMVTHDRFMMERLCDTYLGFTDNNAGDKKCLPFASIQQWQAYNAAPPHSRSNSPTVPEFTANPLPSPPASGKKLSYLEQREYDEIELSIAQAEDSLEKLQEELTAIAENGDNQALRDKSLELQEAEDQIEKLYARWQLLESKKNPAANS
jgi:ATP-binding cassette subfamily F protein uup